jgi:hypothetical protein
VRTFGSIIHNWHLRTKASYSSLEKDLTAIVLNKNKTIKNITNAKKYMDKTGKKLIE